jgi:hypothetical protein
MWHWAGRTAASGTENCAICPDVRNWFRTTFVLAVGLAASGCAEQHPPPPEPARPPLVLVLAPVLNLSGSDAFDALRVTDLIASEVQAFPGVQVVPVNRALSELVQHGKENVESAADAVGLAQALGADGTLVAAVTEYNPYYPPVVGLVMQWYPADGARPGGGARRDAGDGALAGASRRGLPRWGATPVLQVQRVFDASDEEVVEHVRKYAGRKDRHASPYGWERYVKSQELYVRYCGWSLFRTMNLLDESGLEAAETAGAES